MDTADFFNATQATNVCFLSCEGGGDLVYHLVKNRPDLMQGKSRIGAVALVEPGKIFTTSTDGALEKFMEQHTVNFEQNQIDDEERKSGTDSLQLHYTVSSTGGKCEKMQLPPVAYDSLQTSSAGAEHSSNVALGMAITLPHVMEFLAMSKKDADSGLPPSPISHRFVTAEASYSHTKTKKYFTTPHTQSYIYVCYMYIYISIHDKYHII